MCDTISCVVLRDGGSTFVAGKWVNFYGWMLSHTAQDINASYIDNEYVNTRICECMHVWHVSIKTNTSIRVLLLVKLYTPKWGVFRPAWLCANCECAQERSADVVKCKTLAISPKSSAYCEIFPHQQKFGAGCSAVWERYSSGLRPPWKWERFLKIVANQHSTQPKRS